MHTVLPQLSKSRVLLKLKFWRNDFMHRPWVQARSDWAVWQWSHVPKWTPAARLWFSSARLKACRQEIHSSQCADWEIRQFLHNTSVYGSPGKLFRKHLYLMLADGYGFAMTSADPQAWVLIIKKSVGVCKECTCEGMRRIFMSYVVVFLFVCLFVFYLCTGNIDY